MVLPICASDDGDVAADCTFGAVLVLVAPDKFRGTLTARQAAEAIETGWRRSRADDRLDLLPMADGGEGTLETLVDAQGGRTEVVPVSGPLGDPVDAPIGLIDGDQGPTAVIEMARASGLMLLADARRDPRRTTTFGTGELIRAALDAGARRVIVCIGGSATNDGGAGMAQALGVRLLDAEGRDVDPGGESLARLARIDLTALDARIRETTIVGACDVDNPLIGAQGASVTFGPQKGAMPEDVHVLDVALGHLAAVAARDLGADLAHEPGGGAAGGLGFGLMLFCGAHLRPGVDVVMEASGFEARAAEADLLVTGEGALDATSLRGKVVGGVLGIGELLGRPVAVVAGRADVLPPAAADVSTLVDLVGPDAAVRDARRSLEGAAQSLAGRARDLVSKRA
jgi:glycerate 2-kinase